ncbi:myosin-7B-like, partial [Phyllopteryx taeniolatus]|uniref:myosin-7B-like n=1 Tax=Phyllopteryx taeniolatus TaxID=161469 RepID=UPI002AD48E02
MPVLWLGERASEILSKGGAFAQLIEEVPPHLTGDHKGARHRLLVLLFHPRIICGFKPVGIKDYWIEDKETDCQLRIVTHRSFLIHMSRFLDLKDFGDAAPYLRLTNLEHLAAIAQAYDGTKRVWMPDEVEGYVEVEVRELNGDKTTVETKDGRFVIIKEEDLQPTNPPKFDMIEDVAMLTHLNEASVLFNLRRRYSMWMIY